MRRAWLEWQSRPFPPDNFVNKAMEQGLLLMLQ